MACEGYSKELNFVDENKRAKRRSHKQETARADFVREERCSFLGAANHNSSHSEQQLISTRHNEGTLSRTTLCPELNYTPDAKNEIQISFTLTKLFANDSKSAEWLVWGYNSPSHSLNTSALLALSALYFGKHHHSPVSSIQAHKHYSRTLFGLRQALKTPEASSLSVLLASITALCCEMVVSPSYETTLLHASGIGKLIELRGPWRCREGLDFRAFEMMRMVVCIKTIVDRKHCFLEGEEWKTIPWSGNIQAKTLGMIIMDFLAGVGGLLQDFDTLLLYQHSSETEEYSLRFWELDGKIEGFMERLADWKLSWDETYPAISYEKTPAFPNSPFKEAIQYQDLEVANGIMIYYALFILVSDLLASLFSLAPPPPITISVISNPAISETFGGSEENEAVQNAARMICKCIEYYLSPPHETAGGFFLSFPVRMAWQVLPESGVERKWLEGVMRSLSVGGGFGFAGGVLV